MYKHTHYLLCFLLLTPHAYALEGKVVGVTDGDTLAILDVTKSQHRIRLAEIDRKANKLSGSGPSKHSPSSVLENTQRFATPAQIATSASWALSIATV